MAKSDQSQLSATADRLKHGLHYAYNREDLIKGLENELANARTPHAGVDREDTTKIIAYMRQHKLNTVRELVDHLTKKWTVDKTQK